MMVRNVTLNKKDTREIDKVWKAALYLRLSKEDGDKEEKSESNSIQNQKKLLKQFVDMEPDIQIFDIYVDDGYSGTNFDRPDFVRMINDIKKRKVNCVIVKDLSRFGRNYVDAGQYLEKLFPFLDVRFIAINDYIDSFQNPNSMNNILVPFKNLINDEYCRDISNKVRSSLDIKRKQGKHIGSFVCYGYKKNPREKNRLIIDDEAAEVVRDIYKWYISGMSKMGIAKKLDELGVPNPSSYKRSKGFNYRNPNEKNYKYRWDVTTIHRILQNQMYVGDMVQGTRKVVSYKVQVIQPQDEKDWIIVPNTHEAIISREDFALVQQLLKERTVKVARENKLYWNSGYVRCGDCGRNLRKLEGKKNAVNYSYLKCTAYSKTNKQDSCNSHHRIELDKLEELVLSAIQSQVALAIDIDQAIQTIKANSEINKEAKKIAHLLEKSKEEIAKIDTMILDLYPDWKAGMISKNEYIKLKKQFEENREKAVSRVADLEQRVNRDKKEQYSSNQILDEFLKYKNISLLTREVMEALIENVYVYDNNKIKIIFKYQDPFKSELAYLAEKQKCLNEKQKKALSGA